MSQVAEVEQIEMPQYTCHKEVRAFRIKDITSSIPDELLDSIPDIQCALLPDDQRLGVVVVDAAYMDKHRPRAGGYYVLYDDGCKSFSPAAGFEAGYTLK